VFEDEVAAFAEKMGSYETAQMLVEEDHDVVRFYIPPEARWENIVKQSRNLGEYLTDAVRAVARENPNYKESLTLLT